jgi:hypothetical protein
MRIPTLVGAALLTPLFFAAGAYLEAAPAHAMSITCMPFHGHAYYVTMCIVYHDDGSVERFFVEP